MLQLITPTTHVIVDSTPSVDFYDMEPGWGTRIGESLEASGSRRREAVGLPLRAIVTSDQRYDCPFLPKLIEIRTRIMCWRMQVTIRRQTAG